MSTAPLRFSGTARRTGDSPISYYVQKALETPGLISLAAGLVDESHFPVADIREAMNDILGEAKSAKAALQYGSTSGLPALREQCLKRVCHADGTTPEALNLTVNNVLLTTGSQQMLYLLGEILFDPGDIVLCEGPSYFVYHGVLQSQGVKVITVPMDAGGMDLNALEATLTHLQSTGQIERVKLIYTVDYFQNPTGLSLAAERRPKLVDIARRFSTGHRILVLADSAYRELRYDGPDLPGLKSFDPSNEFVIYTTTFSKPCAPGLKTGYSILPHELVAPVANLKGSHDFGSTNLVQHILTRLIASGAYDRHIVSLREVYRTKRDAMLTALSNEFGDWPEVTWTKPGGGMYVWMTFPKHFRTGKGGALIERALKNGVLYIPGELGYRPGDDGIVPTNEIRLSFGVSEPDTIREGVRRLRAACRGLEA